MKARKPDYCTNDSVSVCWECPLTSYGLDCRNKSIAHRDAGSVRSEAKTRACRANGSKGGRRAAFRVGDRIAVVGADGSRLEGGTVTLVTRHSRLAYIVEFGSDSDIGMEHRVHRRNARVIAP